MKVCHRVVTWQWHMMLLNAPEAACKLMYICAVYPRGRKCYMSSLPTIFTMSSLKIKDLKLVHERRFIWKPTSRTTLIKSAGKGVPFEFCPHPEIIETIAWLMSVGELVSRNGAFCQSGLRKLSIRELLFISVESLPLSVSTGTLKRAAPFPPVSKQWTGFCLQVCRYCQS